MADLTVTIPGWLLAAFVVTVGWYALWFLTGRRILSADSESLAYLGAGPVGWTLWLYGIVTERGR